MEDKKDVDPQEDQKDAVPQEDQREAVPQEDQKDAVPQEDQREAVPQEDQKDAVHHEDHETSESSKEAKKHAIRSEHLKNTMYLKREIHYTIEGPNGEQIPMRYKHEMTVETVFQYACKKFNILPEENYMVFNNRELKMKEVLRNLNISQNSVLKIYKDKGVKEGQSQNIYVSVRIKDCRIGSVFRTTDCILDILLTLVSDKSFEQDMVPIVIYQKHEFIGEDMLKQVRLRDMGVTEGPCLIRFLQLKQEDLDQRKLKEDDDAMATLESLELKAAGPIADTGVKSVHFKIDEDELDAENIQFMGERKALAFRLPDPMNIEEAVQEEYFDLVIEEIHSLFVEVARKKGTTRSSEIVEGVKSELKKLRDIRADFDDTLIRVQFPDRTFLQCLFLPEERVEDVRDCVKKFLRDPQDDFELLGGDPLVQLEDQMTLGELGMVPVGRICYQSKDQRYTSIDMFMTDEIVLNFVPPNVAKEASLLLRGDSLDKFIEGDRDSTTRKSTSGFLSKFLRSSNSSNKSPYRAYEGGSRSYSRYHKKSSFGKKSFTHGSTSRNRNVSDDDDSDIKLVETQVPSASISQLPRPSDSKF